jgi:hypothetical protein
LFLLIIGGTTMARRKAARNNAGRKGKAVRKRHHVCVFETMLIFEVVQGKMQ